MFLMMSIATFGDRPSSVATVEDVCRFFSSLGLSKDYSSRIKDLSISGQVLINSNGNSLLDAIPINDSGDRNTILQGINKHLTLSPPTSSTPSSSSTSSPSSLSSNVSSPRSGSQLSPKAFKFMGKNLNSYEGESDISPVKDDSTNRKYLRSIKSRSLDEILSDSMWSGVDCPVPSDTPHSSHLFSVLRAENVSLKKELESYYERVSRLQKLELELQQLQDAYRLLEGTSSRKAKLEKAMRERLEGELLRMKQTQTQQKAQLHSIKRNSSLRVPGTDSSVAQKDREVKVEKLLQQNQESISQLQKIESDLHFTKIALEEKALGTDSARRDEETQGRRKSLPRCSLDNGQEETDLAKTYLSNLEGLQSLMAAMQASSENRQRLEQQLRKQLEDRIQELEKGIGDHKEKREDQEIRIATLEADLAQMEQRCTELLAERQLAMNAIRTNNCCCDKEDELRTVKNKLEVCLARLEEAHQIIYNQENRLTSMDSSLKEKQLLIEKLQSCLSPSWSGHEGQSSFCNGGQGQLPALQNLSSQVSGSPQSAVSRAIRKISSPLPVYNEANHGYCNTVNSTPVITQNPHPPPPTTINPPTLPSYDEHLQGTRYQYMVGHSPIPMHHGSIGSHSFPNTPETVRRKTLCGPPTEVNHHGLCVNPTVRTASGSSLAPQSYGGIYKSLTPPPVHYPKQRPPLVASHSVSQSHTSHCNGTLLVPKHDCYHDDDSVDSLDLLLNSSSSPPYSLSPPSHYNPMGSAYNSSSYAHKHSNSLPTSQKQQQQDHP